MFHGVPCVKRSPPEAIGNVFHETAHPPKTLVLSEWTFETVRKRTTPHDTSSSPGNMCVSQWVCDGQGVGWNGPFSESLVLQRSIRTGRNAPIHKPPWSVRLERPKAVVLVPQVRSTRRTSRIIIIPLEGTMERSTQTRVLGIRKSIDFLGNYCEVIHTKLVFY